MVKYMSSYFIEETQDELDILSRSELNFSLFPFLWKLIDLPGGQINDPSSGKSYSLPFPPATPSSPSRTLKGLFELKRRPSRSLASPRALLPELQRYKDTVRCAALGAEVPGHRQQQLTQTLIVRLLKTHFSTPIFDCDKSTEKNWVSDQTCGGCNSWCGRCGTLRRRIAAPGWGWVAGQSSCRLTQACHWLCWPTEDLQHKELEFNAQQASLTQLYSADKWWRKFHFKYN